jgi:hypothetical protein
VSDFGVEIEWAALFVTCALGSSLFGTFEVGTDWWRLLARWLLAAMLTIGSYLYVGHWSLVLLGSLLVIGTAAHFRWCRKHGIHPFTAEPKAKYRELRGWPTQEQIES